MVATYKYLTFKGSSILLIIKRVLVRVQPPPHIKKKATYNNILSASSTLASAAIGRLAQWLEQFTFNESQRK